MKEKISALNRDQAYYFERLKKGEKMYIAVLGIIVCVYILDKFIPWAAMWENLGPLFWIAVAMTTVFSVVADIYGKKLYNAIMLGESREICRMYADKRKKRYILYSVIPGMLLLLSLLGMLSNGPLYEFYKAYLSEAMIMFSAITGSGIGYVQRTKYVYQIIDIFTE